MNKPILISAGVICAIILVSGFLNQSNNSSTNNPGNNFSQEDPKQKEIVDNLDNIARIEGQKIKAINGSVMELDNSEKIDFGSNPIKCSVGDVIENYTVANQSIVCVRKDNQGNVVNSIIMPLAYGIAGGILGNYIASKIFANNNGVSRMPNSYDYRGSNGQVYNSQEQTNSYQSNGTRNTTSNTGPRRTYSTNRNTGLGGLLGATTTNNDNDNGSNKSGSTGTTKPTGGLSTGSKGGISTGSKGGGGG
jgi:hypothetical protein